MGNSIIIGLLQNIALLLTFSMLYDYFWSGYKNHKNLYFKLGSGVVLGGIGIILILTPWHFIPGIFFDTRSVILSISGLFFGPIPTIVAMFITGLFRFSMGGVGTQMGIAVALTSGTIGILWGYYRPDWYKKKQIVELVAMGVLVHLVMLCCTFLLPAEIRWEIFRHIALPAILIYPLATVLLGILMINQDKNREIRTALNLSEERFRTIIEQSTDAMYLSDLEGNIIDTNQQACKSLGYTRDELLKLKIMDMDSEFDDPEKVKASFEKIEPNENKTFESLHRQKNGTTFPVEISTSLIHLNGSPFVLGFVRDISDRKENELKIIRMGQHYQALIEKAPDGIVLINAEGNFKFVSPSARKLFGYSTRDEITGNPAEFTHPEDLPAVLILIQNLMQDSSLVQTIQYRFCDKNGNWKWIESTFSNLLDDPSVEAIVINFREITDRKLVEEQIRKLNEELEQKVTDRTIELEIRGKELISNEAALLNLVEDLNLKSEELQAKSQQLELVNKELEAFSYSVSHDLRAPLRAINGFISILIEEYGDKIDYEGKRICGVILSNAIKMGQLIDDLLSFSRLIRSEVNHSQIDMESLVKKILSELESVQNIKTSNIITLQSLPGAIGDANLIKQVWVNLISNALKYSGKNENPAISIGAFPKDTEIVYFIKDNGVGFSMNYAHKLFDVFQRLHTTAEFEGTGVGLAIVKRIISRHGGKVWAESEIGKGATFYFSLPGIIQK